jgi:hypothetical protein
VSAQDNDKQYDDTDRILTEFFQSERPSQWPEPPWRKHVTSRRAHSSARGRMVLVAALVLAAVGLAWLGEPPSSWPGSQELLTKGKMEASRVPAATKKSPLPGFRVPELPDAPKSRKN